MNPSDLRARIAAREWTRPTIGLAPRYLQANLAVVPQAHAFDFLCFCVRNPKPCPVLAVTEPGSPLVPGLGGDADLRSALPRYRVFERGVVVDEPLDVVEHWRDDLVGVLLGCSLSFEQALVDAGVPVRHLDAGTECPVYVTTQPCEPAGRFRGPLVVSMRPVPADLVPLAVTITSRYPHCHGAPVAIGDAATLGIKDIRKPDFGDPPVLTSGDVPVFWACGVTPQVAAIHAQIDLMITHAPGHMFVTDQTAAKGPL